VIISALNWGMGEKAERGVRTAPLGQAKDMVSALIVGADIPTRSSPSLGADGPAPCSSSTDHDHFGALHETLHRLPQPGKNRERQSTEAGAGAAYVSPCQRFAAPSRVANA